MALQRCNHSAPNPDERSKASLNLVMLSFLTKGGKVSNLLCSKKLRKTSGFGVEPHNKIKFLIFSYLALALFFPLIFQCFFSKHRLQAHRTLQKNDHKNNSCHSFLFCFFCHDFLFKDSFSPNALLLGL